MPYMDNTITLGSRVRHVIVSYPAVISDYLGVTQIVLGFLCLILGAVGLAIGCHTSSPATTLLLCPFMVGCGVLGVLAGVRKETWAVAGYLVSAIIALGLSFVLLGASISGVAREYKETSSTSVEAREGVDIAVIALSILTGASTVGTLVITVPHVLAGCKCVKGATYVPDPVVQYSATSPDHTGTTGYNKHKRPSNTQDDFIVERWNEPVENSEPNSAVNFQNPLY